MKIHSTISCPGCHGLLAPTQLTCRDCEISVSGTFALNEFAALAEDDLHFLRIFILCEGRIRDMESALGVSYPTIKTRLAQLKNTLGSRNLSAEALPAATAVPAVPPVPAQPADVPAEHASASILQSLQSGKLTYEQAMQQLRQNSHRKD